MPLTLSPGEDVNDSGHGRAATMAQSNLISQFEKRKCEMAVCVECQQSANRCIYYTLDSEDDHYEENALISHARNMEDVWAFFRFHTPPDDKDFRLVDVVVGSEYDTWIKIPGRPSDVDVIDAAQHGGFRGGVEDLRIRGPSQHPGGYGQWVSLDNPVYVAIVAEVED